MDEAERCSRVGLMYEGRIVVCDAPEQIKGLVAGDLLEVRLSDALGPGSSGQSLRRAEEVVAGVAGVLEVQTYGDLLHVFVDSAGLRQERLRAALSEAGIEAIGVRETRPRMEEAFISLVRRQMEEDGARTPGARTPEARTPEARTPGGEGS
jgi:ABC-2 type transport system ATP-binding protein